MPEHLTRRKLFLKSYSYKITEKNTSGNYFLITTDCCGPKLTTNQGFTIIDNVPPLQWNGGVGAGASKHQQALMQSISLTVR